MAAGTLVYCPPAQSGCSCSRLRTHAVGATRAPCRPRDCGDGRIACCAPNVKKGWSRRLCHVCGQAAIEAVGTVMVVVVVEVVVLLRRRLGMIALCTGAVTVPVA